MGIVNPFKAILKKTRFELNFSEHPNIYSVEPDRNYIFVPWYIVAELP